MDPIILEEIKEKEKADLIKRWKLKQIMKYKKGTEKERMKRELNKLE